MKTAKKKARNKEGGRNKPKSNLTEMNRDEDVVAKPKRRELDDEKKKRKQMKKKNVGGEDRQQSDDGSKQPVATIKYTRGGIEREFRFLKTVNSLEDLHDFCFKHSCAFKNVKKSPKFSTVALACHQSAPSQKGCPYKWLARRPSLEHGEIHVYAHGEHNHTLKPEAKRSSHKGGRNVLMTDEDAPPTQLTPDGLEWTFQRTVENFEALNKCRIENGCNYGDNWNAASNSNQYRLHCWNAYKVARCPFFMLARKTIKQRYHVYIRGQHTCANRTKKQHKRHNGGGIEESGGKPSKRSRKEEKQVEDDEEMEEDRNMEAEQTEDDAPPIVKEYSLKIQRRLGHSLRKGQAERAHKWMERVGLDQIGTILTGCPGLENVVKLMEMADRRNEPNSNLTEVNRDDGVVAKPKRRELDDEKKKRRKKAMNEEEESSSMNDDVAVEVEDEMKKPKKRHNGGEDRQQQQSDESAQPAATIKYKTINGIEREFHFVKTLNTVDQLKDFSFKHNCSFITAKNCPNFLTLTLVCQKSSGASRTGCPYRLLARRLSPEHDKMIDVYAHGEHNHTVKPEGKRLSYKLIAQSVLMPDEDPPPTQQTPDGTEWTLKATLANFAALKDCWIANHCLQKPTWNSYRTRCLDTNCPFLMLTLKTTKQRYHVYTHGQHNCADMKKNQNGKKRSLPTVERGSKPNKRSRKEDEEIEAEQTVEEDGGQGAPPIVKEYSLEKIQRRLGHSLRKGQAERAHKWMERVDLEQIDTILTGMDLENVIRLMEMADREIREDKESIKFWLPWMQRTLRCHGSNLHKAPILLECWRTVFSNK